MGDSVFDEIRSARARLTYTNRGLCRVCSEPYSRETGGRSGMCNAHYRAAEAKVRNGETSWEALDKEFPFKKDARGAFASEPSELLEVIKLREAEFQNHVVKELTDAGHGVWHLDPTKTRGIPDLLIITSKGRVLFRELKTTVGEPEHHQLRLMQRMRDHGYDVDIWRPEDFRRIPRDLG